jgi:nucleoside-diphosphate-sugar epimerase
MRVLVTGAPGFIGAHVVRGLIADGHDTYALVRPGNEAPRLDAVVDQLTLVSGDLGDPDRMTSVVADIAPDAIIHLAWYVEPGAYRHAVAENIESVRASATLLRAAADAGCPRVVLGGTCLEGDIGAVRAIYESAKAAVHRLGEGFADAGVSVACGHVFHLYGPMEDERRVIPSIIRALGSGESIATTTGTQRRDYLHVADVAAGFVALAGSSITGGVDICSGTIVTLADVFAIIGDQTGRRDLLRLGELGHATDDLLDPIGDPEPLRRLGWRPRYDLRTGISETIRWWTDRRLEART